MCCPWVVDDVIVAKMCQTICIPMVVLVFLKMEEYREKYMGGLPYAPASHCALRPVPMTQSTSNIYVNEELWMLSRNMNKRVLASD